MFSKSLFILAAIPLLSQLLPVLAQGGATCNSTVLCHENAPCCSEFGFCGTGTFCLGGCNALWSHTPASCEPSPLCQSAVHTFADNSRILTNGSLYDGNATKWDWIVDKGSVLNTNANGGELSLTLTETNGGTRLSSTRYLHYGTVTTRIKTGRWRGVVTAFITMSDVKDEIDWEFPGGNITEGQTNYYVMAIPDYTHGFTVDGLTDTFANYHDYTIDWQPDALTFLIDGKAERTVQKTDFGGKYPSTPARVQLSLWPAGINTSAPGTIDWAGGMINWQDPDYISAGHFYTLVQSVSINCSDPAGSVPAGAVSYVYGPNATTGAVPVPAVLVTNESTIVNGASSMMTSMSAWTFWVTLLMGGTSLLF